MTKTTKAQRLAIFRKWKQCPKPSTQSHALTYRQFRSLAFPAFGGDCIMLPWAGMIIGIEKDGYTHS